jgi:hypothetical protein
MSLSLQVSYKNNLDLITFFPRENTISCPSELWFETICASLRMKHFVLVLSQPLEVIPQLDDTKRWATGVGWCSISPRGLSSITEANSLKTMTFEQLLDYLRSSK